MVPIHIRRKWRFADGAPLPYPYSVFPYSLELIFLKRLLSQNYCVNSNEIYMTEQQHYDICKSPLIYGNFYYAHKKIPAVLKMAVLGPERWRPF